MLIQDEEREGSWERGVERLLGSVPGQDRKPVQGANGGPTAFSAPSPMPAPWSGNPLLSE